MTAVGISKISMKLIYDRINENILVYTLYVSIIFEIFLSYFVGDLEIPILQGTSFFLYYLF